MTDLFINAIFGVNVGFEYLPAPDDEPDIKSMFNINLFAIQLCFVTWRE